MIRPDLIVQEAARRRLLNFSLYMSPRLDLQPFHLVYYRLLDMFAHGQIRKMIVQMPPQHGKSEGSSRKLPAFILGRNPNARICIGSYSQTIARDFNRDVQRIMDTTEYRQIFPASRLSGSGRVNMENVYQRNTDVIEVVGHRGSLRVVGRGGSLTSKTVDIVILDDVYKDYAEGNSPVIRNAAWKWYTTVVRTRLHNDSQELIVFTRWHEDDLIGRLEKSEKIVDIRTWADVANIEPGAWVRINFEALKTGAPSEFDPREAGAALWPGRHSLARLEAQRRLDPIQFSCLFQGNPASSEGRLYQTPFRTYVNKADYGTFVRSGNYTDVADQGDDFLASICYDIYKSENTVYNEHTRKWEPIVYALITDIEYTDEPGEVTTVTVPQMLNRNGTQKAWVESNNGGNAWGRAVQKGVRCAVEMFYQHQNKEARIITASAMVNSLIIFPLGWVDRWPRAYEHITTFLRDFDANAHDDIVDALTGIYEKELARGSVTPYGAASRGIKILN